MNELCTQRADRRLSRLAHLALRPPLKRVVHELLPICYRRPWLLLPIEQSEQMRIEQLEDLRRSGWLKPGQIAWYNAGIYIFQPVVYEFTARLEKSPRGEYELTTAIASLIASGERVMMYPIKGGWRDVGRPEDLTAAEQLVD